MGLPCCDSTRAVSTKLTCQLLPPQTAALWDLAMQHFAPEGLLVCPLSFSPGGEPLQEEAVGVGASCFPVSNACTHNDSLVGLSTCGTPHPGGFCTSCQATLGR